VQKQMEMEAAWQALRRRVLRQGAIPAVPRFCPGALPVGHCSHLCGPGSAKGLALWWPSAETLQVMRESLSCVIA